MNVALSDADVVRRIGSGHDHEAESELFRRMAPRVRLYGLRHLRDGHAADDLTQQVLITTLEALRAGRLREPEKLASFVSGTCRMTVLDIRRGAQRKERLLAQLCLWWEALCLCTPCSCVSVPPSRRMCVAASAAAACGATAMPF